MTLEVPVYGIDTAILAEKFGANRIELCAGFPEGGTTPSYSTIKIAKERLNIPINVMIRPRGGDFYYSNNEFRQILLDIELCQSLGINGVVFGILNKNGSLDKIRCKELVIASGKMKKTLHRAFDRTNNPYKALEDAIECGFDTILTSGQKPTAEHGIELIAELVEKANNKISILPGCGINSDNILKIIETTKAKEFHASAKKTIPSEMTFKNNSVKMSEKENNEINILTIDTDEIKKILSIINNI